MRPCCCMRCAHLLGAGVFTRRRRTSVRPRDAGLRGAAAFARREEAGIVSICTFRLPRGGARAAAGVPTPAQRESH